MPKIVVYTSTGCNYCAKIKKELTEWGFTYEERNVIENKAYFNDLHEKGIFSTPVTFIDEQSVIGYRPNKMKQILGVTEEMLQTAQVAGGDKAGIEAEQAAQEAIFTDLDPAMYDQTYDLVCIGSGPAGASAAVYAARGKLKVLVVDKGPASGALAITHKIANYPGVQEELTGLELVDRIRRQAKEYGATFVRGNVQSLNVDGETKEVVLPEGTIKTKSIFVAVGARGRTKKLKGEDEFAGRGVSYCTTCDAAFFEGRTVAVVGDNEEAVSEASTIAQFAQKVLFLIPGKKLSGQANLDDLDGQNNIEVLFSHRVKEILGEEDGKLEGLLVEKEGGETERFEVHGVFLYVAGNKPATDFVGDTLKRDEEGYIEVDFNLQTSVEGVFAGGDARKTPLKQAVIAAADGAVAALGADKHVNKRKRLIPQYS
ncbi:thioredoxin reductase (NADPH) [Tumebacillus sp. BK434]|uniref:FAD-dependent oxidoreductase n=1 Tax=Tumebacillus sp. BK434 TaxID=2512169 RepID=UPI0010E944FE|nr:FAD-dependent oxidoreductase [Tumebacillus sp. BK434]TCP53934.1 thioredoxin reductase (NADPH) [Tumebacillus sp. BK434]